MTGARQRAIPRTLPVGCPGEWNSPAVPGLAEKRISERADALCHIESALHLNLEQRHRQSGRAS